MCFRLGCVDYWVVLILFFVERFKLGFGVVAVGGGVDVF